MEQKAEIPESRDIKIWHQTKKPGNKIPTKKKRTSINVTRCIPLVQRKGGRTSSSSSHASSRQIIRNGLKRNRYSPVLWWLSCSCATRLSLNKQIIFSLSTLRTGDADLRFYITTVRDGWRKSAFLKRACFPCTIHLIMQYIEPVYEWSCWRMFIETWPHSELNFRHRASSI